MLFTEATAPLPASPASPFGMFAHCQEQLFRSDAFESVSPRHKRAVERWSYQPPLRLLPVFHSIVRQHQRRSQLRPQHRLAPPTISPTPRATPLATPWSQRASCHVGAPRYTDDFEDRSLAGSGSSGISWVVAQGSATVDRSLHLARNNTVVLSHPATTYSSHSTLEASVTSNWSYPARILLLYRDAQNYYFLGLSGDRGLFRVMNGTTTRIDDGYLALRTTLPHASGATRRYKVFVGLDQQQIEFAIDVDGLDDGSDFEFAVTDTDPTAIQRFTSQRFGFAEITSGATSTSASVFIDNVAIYDGCRRAPPRTPVTLHVSSSTGNDSADGSISTPLRTIARSMQLAKAGDTVLIAPGLYEEANLRPTYAGVAGAPITFAALDPTNRSRLRGSLPSHQVSWSSGSSGRSSAMTAVRPLKVYDGETPLRPAQEPEVTSATNPDVTGDLLPITEISNRSNRFSVSDTARLTAWGANTLRGATLVHYDSASNFFTFRTVVSHTNGVLVAMPPGDLMDAGSDRYVIRNHPALLDEPGEFSIESGLLEVTALTINGSSASVTVRGTELYGTVTGATIYLLSGDTVHSANVNLNLSNGGEQTVAVPLPSGMTNITERYAVVTTTNGYRVTVRPPTGGSLATIRLVTQPGAITLTGGVNEHLIFRGLDIAQYAGDGITVSANGGLARHITVLDNIIHHNEGSGIGARHNCFGLVVDNNELAHNVWNGLSIGWGENHVVTNNRIHRNQDNGIWLGSGGAGSFGNGLWHVEDVLISGNHFHDQESQRRHPDNLQFQQVNRIVIERNHFEQTGHQNTWFQYNGEVYLFNNIFINGPVGFNSAREGYIFNNTFYNSVLRFDAWQDDPRFNSIHLEFRNNIFIGSTITRPPETQWGVLRFSNNFVAASNANGLNIDPKSIIISSTAPADLAPYVGDLAMLFTPPSPSPLVNAGFRDLPFSDDYLGNDRFRGAAPDIGPYERNEAFTYRTCDNGEKDGDESGIDCGGVCLVDDDGDGFSPGHCTPSLRDCRDDDRTIYPGAAEQLDGEDRNCDGAPHPLCATDLDGDGFPACDDNCPSISNSSQSDIDGDRLGDACDTTTTLVDTFEERFTGTGDITADKGAGKIRWQVVSSSATIGFSNGTKFLRFAASNEAATQRTAVLGTNTAGSQVTLTAMLGKNWTLPATGALLAMASSTSYYLYDLSTGTVSRWVNGTQDAQWSTGNNLRLAHSDNAWHQFTFEARYIPGTGYTFTIGCTGVAPVTVIDPAPLWTSGGIGFQRGATTPSSNGLSVDDVTVQIVNSP